MRSIILTGLEKIISRKTAKRLIEQGYQQRRSITDDESFFKYGRIQSPKTEEIFYFLLESYEHNLKSQ